MTSAELPLGSTPTLGLRTAGRLLLSKTRTLPTAMAFVRDFCMSVEGRTLLNHAGQFYRWGDNCYSPVEDQELRNELQTWLHEAWCVRQAGASLVWEPFDANSTTIKQALDALRDYVHVPRSAAAPSWLDRGDERPALRELLVCKSMTLHIPTSACLRPTPLLFNTCSLGFDYEPQARDPARWLSFLHEALEGDLESVKLLQEWMGYLLTPDTSQQKILLMVGPRRSGKGTIARVLAQLIGSQNVVSPTTTSLSGAFGLQPLIGKSLAIVSDARFRGEGVATVVERLLCISGEDSITVDRKYLGAVTMTLPTRFMILSNEVPRLQESSTALAGRFLGLHLRKSFYGKEDPHLTDKLLVELPGILLWAIEGWKRLRSRGRFLVPASASSMQSELEELSSPVQAFVREHCIVGPGQRVEVRRIYQRWKQWCEDDGRSRTTTKATFGRDLSALLPGVRRRRGTGDVGFYEGIGLRC